MFTGIVEEIGRLVEVTDTGPDARMRIRGPLACSDAQVGDSICVSGICLTVTGLDGGEFTVDLMPETVARTTARTWEVGRAVNLERALPAGGRLGGHVVQGHVDGAARLVARRPGPRWDELDFALEAGLARYVAAKGSICLDGVSLTVTEAREAGFSVALIPTTLAATTLGDLQAGQEVNVEVDVLAKYVERLLAARVASGATSEDAAPASEDLGASGADAAGSAPGAPDAVGPGATSAEGEGADA